MFRLEIKDLSASGGDWALVGLVISQSAAPTLTSTTPRYVFMLQTVNATSGNWFYRVRRENTDLYTSGSFSIGSSA